MKVKALKLFGDGERLYKEGEITDKTKEWVELINSTPNAPLVEVIEKDSKGVDIDGNINRSSTGKGKSRNKNK